MCFVFVLFLNYLLHVSIYINQGQNIGNWCTNYGVTTTVSLFIYDIWLRTALKMVIVVIVQY